MDLHEFADNNDWESCDGRGVQTWNSGVRASDNDPEVGSPCCVTG
jgi:hypothetical protein